MATYDEEPPGEASWVGNATSLPGVSSTAFDQMVQVGE